jgi:hypothetical protein
MLEHVEIDSGNLNIMQDKVNPGPGKISEVSRWISESVNR